MAILKIILTGFFLIFVALILIFSLFFYFNMPVLSVPAVNGIEGENLSEESFQIKQGESLNSIANRLQEYNLIRSSRFLVLYAKYKQSQVDFKTGIYTVSPALTTLEIHDLLVTGKQQLFRVTIPEGWTFGRIGSLLEKEGIVKREAFIEAVHSPALIEKYNIPSDSLEGFLYPDTYYFQKDYPAVRIVSHMIENFYKNLEKIDPNTNRFSNDDIYEKVVLASIIEREYRAADEASLMASVFYNRLERGIALGSCATIVYIMTEIEGKAHPDFLTYRDLEIVSPYNTYIHRGLPPGPIANPGRISLDAVFNPDESDYLFFLLKDPEAGRHHFSRTLSEHNQAHRLYLKSN